MSESTAKDRQELTFRLMLGTSYSLTKGSGSPEVEQTLSRARELALKVDNPTQLMRVLVDLRAANHLRGSFHSARELCQQAVDLAPRVENHLLATYAHASLGHTLFSLGEFAEARRQLEHGLSRYAQRQASANTIEFQLQPGVFNLSVLALVLWYLGYPDQAVIKSQEARALAETLSHPPTQEYALSSAAILRQLRAQAKDARVCIEAAMTISQAQGFTMRLALGGVLQGWALAMGSETEQGISQMTRELAAYQATGSEAWHHYWLALLAEAHGQAGQAQAGLVALNEALALVEKNGECYYHSELYRIKAELLQAAPLQNPTEAETCFHQALAVARQQQAKSLELRSATHLARLWQLQGKHQAAYDLLTPVYNGFTEGFDTTDLQNAKALLSELMQHEKRV